MKDLRDILAEADALRQHGRPFALATVTKVDGSAYRRPGARMLVTGEAGTCGAISGGCLEAEVAQHALEVMETGRPRVVVFDVEDDDPFLGFGSGCGGTVQVLIEATDGGGPLALLRTCLAERTPAVLATVIEADEDDLLGQRLLVRPDGPEAGTLVAEPIHALVRKDAPAVLADGHSQITAYALETGETEVLYEVVQPAIRLVVCGDGHDVAPVTRFGRLLGWEVVVIGRKPQPELAERFPDAERHVFLMHPDQLAEHVTLDPRTASVVMSHNFLRDRALLGALLTSPAAYVGALGPRHRTERLLDDLRGDGVPLPPDVLDRLHAPVGLDLGTETPEEIALSIVAEIQAVLHDRDARPLRTRQGPIHEPIPIG